MNLATQRLAMMLDKFRTESLTNKDLEIEFNQLSEKLRLGLYLRNGRFYPDLVGKSHTTALVQECSKQIRKY